MFTTIDDMGWGEPGLYPSTSPHGRISTPNLDKFGQEGIQFTHAYAGYTVCGECPLHHKCGGIFDYT